MASGIFPAMPDLNPSHSGNIANAIYTEISEQFGNSIWQKEKARRTSDSTAPSVSSSGSVVRELR
jgi:hypothetical protein